MYVDRVKLDNTMHTVTA